MTDEQTKRVSTAALLRSDIAVALREMGLSDDAIKSLPRPLVTYLSELHKAFMAADEDARKMAGEVTSAQSDLARLRRQRDLLRAALANVDLEDPNDEQDYSGDVPTLPKR